MKRTSLHLAVLNNNPSSIELLMEEGADPNSQDIDLCTPLHYAIEYGHIKILEKFMEYKNVDLSLRNHQKMTPIDCCRDRKAYSLL